MQQVVENLMVNYSEHKRTADKFNIVERNVIVKLCYFFVQLYNIKKCKIKNKTLVTSSRYNILCPVLKGICKKASHRKRSAENSFFC